MNKTILGLLLAVCVLGMTLIMLKERLHTAPPAVNTENPQSAAPVHPQTQAPLPPIGASLETAGTSPVDREIAQPAPTPDRLPAQALTLPPEGGEKQANPPAAEKTPPEPARQGTPKAPVAETLEKPAKAPAQPKIDRFVVFARDTGATLRLVGNGPISYINTSLQNPERLVIDLNGQWQIKAPGVPKNPLVTNVRIGKSGGKTRVVIDLAGKPARTRHVLSKDHRMLDIRVDTK